MPGDEVHCRANRLRFTASQNDLMADPVQQLRQLLARYSHIERWLVAYSGGLDSSTLLHSLVKVAPRQAVLAVHVHHNLSPHADQWQQHCRATCAELGVAFISEKVQLDSRSKGLEEAARRARYGVFERLLESADALLMAHHRDDQAETILLRLMRGSGARGLAAMSESRPLGAGTLLRPWLNISREEIADQATAWGIRWIEDESNLSQDFDRNYLRHSVTPRLQRRWPNFATRWQQSARLLRQYDALAEQVAAQDLQAAAPRVERVGSSIELRVLQALDEFRRGNLLRHWLGTMRLPLPEQVQLQEIESQLLSAGSSEATVSWGDVRVRCFQGRLHVFPYLPSVPANDIAWTGQSELQWGAWRLSLQRVSEGGFDLPEAGFIVSPRATGERCRPCWRNHSQTLKKLLQEVQLPPWLRDQVPLLRGIDDHLIVAVGDLWVCHNKLARSAAGYQLRWRLGPIASESR